MTRVKCVGPALLVCILAGGFESTARADGESGKAVAEALFHDAKALLESGSTAAACPKFAESLAIDRTLGTLLYLAACHEQQDRATAAWSEFSSALAWATRTSQGDRAAFAQKHMTNLEPKLGFIVISAPVLEDLELKLDNNILSGGVIGNPLPLDPGTHTIEASAPDHASWRDDVTVTAGSKRVAVNIPALAVGNSGATASNGADDQSPKVPAKGGSGDHLATWSAVAVAGAGIAVGSIFGVLTFGARDSAEKECPNNRCVPGGLDDVERARTYATVSTIGFGVGLVGAAVATYFFLTGNHDDHSQRSAAAVSAITPTPALSAHGAGISVQGIFE